MFLFFLLKSAANAVLKLMSASIAIAHVLAVSIKLLSVRLILLEYSLGKLKNDSTILLISGILEPSSVSAFKSPVSLAVFQYFKLVSFQCG